MTPPSPPPVDARLLLEHAQWMRRLARTLVGDAQRADDLSQETWRRLLERPPRLDQPFRGWIATVMRNLVRAEHRGSVRREARERASARGEAEPSSHDIVERAALQREMVQAVLELPEPYRTTLLLRYFEDRTPHEIAERERIPLATVKTRLARGIARLRARLARTRGPDGRASVLLALARAEGVAVTARPLPPPAVGLAASLAMNTKILVPLLLLAAAGVAYFLETRAPAAATPPADESVPGDRTSELGPAPSRTPPSVAQREEAAAEPVLERAALPPAPPQPAARVRGRVIDVEGAPVSAVEIALSPLESPLTAGRTVESEPAPAVARSGADGAFELAGLRSGRLFVRDPRWTTLLAGVPVDQRSGQECRIVVAPRIALAGVVVDELGSALADVRVALVPPPTLRASLEQVLDFSADVAWETTTDEVGRFRLGDAPAIEGGVLRAAQERFLPHEEPAPLASRADLVLVLARPSAEGGVLRGTVVDPSGLAAGGAHVSLGIDVTRTDDDGRFAFRLDDPESFSRKAEGFGMPVPRGLLRALKPGYLPAELRAAREPDGSPRWPQPIVLRLGPEPLALAGRVLDSGGEPLEGMRVWLADPTFFGGLVRGSGAERFPEFAQVESLLAGAGPGWSYAETGDDGRFVLEGLTDREYRVAAMDPSTLQRAEVRAVAGRRDVELVLASDDLMPRLAGRIVDGRGEGVANAAVFLMCDALETRVEGQTVSTQHESTAGTRTDQNGWFELARVPERAVYLRIQGDDVLPLEWGRGVPGGLEELAGESREELVITLERRCHFQVELSVPAEADELAVLDAAGREMVVSQFFGTGRKDTERHAVADGRSATLAVGDRAATLVLYRAGAEVRRVPLRLAPGAPQVVRL